MWLVAPLSRIYLSLRSWLMSFMLQAHAFHGFTEEFCQWWKTHCLFAVLGQKFRSFPSLKERYRNVVYAAEGRDFQVFSSSFEVCVLSQTLVLTPDFSRLRRRLSSLVTLIARFPWSCWVCSALSLKASCRKSFLKISMEKSFDIPQFFFGSRKMEKDP